MRPSPLKELSIPPPHRGRHPDVSPREDQIAAGPSGTTSAGSPIQGPCGGTFAEVKAGWAQRAVGGVHPAMRRVAGRAGDGGVEPHPTRGSRAAGPWAVGAGGRFAAGWGAPASGDPPCASSLLFSSASPPRPGSRRGQTRPPHPPRLEGRRVPPSRAGDFNRALTLLSPYVADHPRDADALSLVGFASRKRARSSRRRRSTAPRWRPTRTILGRSNTKASCS